MAKFKAITTDSAAYRRGKRQRPSVRITRTVGGFYRVVIHGQNNLVDDGTYAEFEIACANTREQVLSEADAWFSSMENR